MSGQDTNGKRTRLVIIIASLLIVAVCLAVAIVLIPNKSEDDTAANDSLALDIIADIDEKFYNYEYSMDDAIARYEQEIQTEDVEKKAILTIDYANFVLKNTGDLQKAITIMKQIEPLDNNIDNKLRYYVALRDLCNQANDEGCKNEYDNIVNQLINEPGGNSGTIQDA